MYQTPRGYTLVPIQALGTPTGSPLRRILVLGALIALVGFATLKAGTANADTFSGYGTNGTCLTEGAVVTLWSQSAVNVAEIGIKYRLMLHNNGSQPAVAQGGWVLSNGSTWETSYWQNNSLGAGPQDKYLDVGSGTLAYPGDVGTSVRLLSGTTGTLKYQVVMRGYGAGACMAISNVVVNRFYFANPGGTPAPGGGGFTAPTPTPATPTAGPTTPAVPTRIPSGTPGPGSVCWQTSAGTNVCYPTPPEGWCYSIPPGGTVTLIKCASQPTPSPGATAAPWQHLWTFSGCLSYGTVLGSSRGACVVSNLVNMSTAGALLAGTTWQGAAANTITLRVVTTTASVDHANPLRLVCGVGTTSGWVMDNPFTDQWAAFSGNYVPASRGTINTTIGINTAMSSSANYCYWIIDDAGAYLNLTGYADVQAYYALGSPTPPPTTAPASGVPALPSDYYGSGNATPPPAGGINAGDPVDICADPTITACAHTFPPQIDLCVQHPEISACVAATATPTFGPFGNPGAGGGINGSPAPNGVAACAAASHPPKPGILPLDTFRPPPSPPANPFDWVVQGVGGGISNAVTSGTNVAKGAINTGIDFVVPGPCVGTVITDFADGVQERVPFAWFAEVHDAISATGGGGVEIGTFDIAGAEVDMNEPIAAVAAVVSPYGAVLRLFPWVVGALIIMRKVMGTVGAGEGGG